MSIELVMPSNHLIPCHLFLFLTKIFLSIRVFSNESVLCIRWAKYWSFRISPSNGYSGLISFKIDCFDIHSIQGNLKNLLQHHSSKTSVLRCSAFFMVQLSHPYMTTGKTIALTGWIFAAKVMSLHFNVQSRLVIAFLPRIKCLLFHGCSHHLFDFGGQENKVCHCFHYLPIYFPWSDGTKCHDVNFWLLSFNPTFSLSDFTFIKRLFSSSISAIRCVIYISEAIDISPGNLHPSLCCNQPGISHDVICI